MRDYTIRKDFPLTAEQNEVVEFMLQRSKCINACQTGLGKTYSSLTALTYLLLKYPDTHAIIIVPQKAVKAFKRELDGKLRIMYNVLTSHEENINGNARITIITYTSLHKFLPYIDGLHKTKKLILMCDEAHILGDSNNKTYTMIASIRHYFNVCWFLTATPLKNDISGLFWLFNMLDPNIFKDWNTFRQSFCVVERKQIMRVVGKGKNKRKSKAMIEEIIGYKNLDVLKEILDKYVILKQKEYNLEFLYHSVELDGYLVEPYLEAGKGLLRDSSKDSFGVRLHDIQSVVDNINPYYKTNTMTNKEQMLIKLVAYKIRRNEPTIIYCDYNDVIDRLETLLNYSKKITGLEQILKVTGEVTQKKREKVEEQINEKTVVLITSAGTESINLQKANSIIFYDIPYSIVALIQCIGRVTRMDSKFDKQYIHFIETIGTIDTYKKYLIQSNIGLITMVFGKMETLPLDLNSKDKAYSNQVKDALLWCFKQGRLLTEKEINKLIL